MTALPMVEVFYDCASPWSYIAFERLSALAAKGNFEITWRPVVAGGVFAKANPGFIAAREQASPAKVAYTKKDIADWAADTGVSLVFPPKVFPVNSIKCMRVCLAADDIGRQPVVARILFQAYFQDDLDISDAEVVRDRLNGIPETREIMLRSASDSVKTRLIYNCDELVRRGGFGVPTMFLGDDMYFGADRIDLLAKSIDRSAGMIGRV